MRARGPRRLRPVPYSSSHTPAPMPGKTYWVYLLTNTSTSVLYVGMTNDLERRLAEHREGSPGSFTERYRVWKLVYAEPCRTPWEAIEREKRLKRWRRRWKEELVARVNPRFRALRLADVGEMVTRAESAPNDMREAPVTLRGDPGSGPG